MTVLVDLRQMHVNTAGRIVLDAPGCFPTLSARMVEALAADASVRAVLLDGARPLTATPLVHADRLPAAVRAAVTARDQRCRFPGSRRPLEDVHHLDKARDGHHVDRALGLSRFGHARMHKHGWRAEIDPASGEATFTRGGQTWVTVPPGTSLRDPPLPAPGHVAAGPPPDDPSG